MLFYIFAGKSCCIMKELLNKVVSHFDINGRAVDIKPLGNGLINDTYLVATEGDAPDYVLQRINHAIFTDVDTLMTNILAVTSHIRVKLTTAGETDIDRKVLTFVPLRGEEKYYFHDGENYWRMMVFIPGSHTFEAVNPASSRNAGRAFRLRQLREAVAADPVGRVAEVRPILDELEKRAREMTKAERLHREGKLPKRICHCDTKVNNMMFDEEGNILCVIDLDTVMPSFIFSDYGDFLRTGANPLAEDDPDIDRVEFDMDIFRAFTEGYLSSAGGFLTPVEVEHLPYAAALFPYMQAVRFLTDYINGDTYYKIKYPGHNLVRTRNQFRLLLSVEVHTPEMKRFIAEKLSELQGG